jgi:hypothetical protein
MRVCEAESIPDLCFAIREWHSTTIISIGLGAGRKPSPPTLSQREREQKKQPEKVG